MKTIVLLRIARIRSHGANSDAAMLLYEPWMEPNWSHRQPSPIDNNRKLSAPAVVDTSHHASSHYKYFPEYNVDVTSLKTQKRTTPIQIENDDKHHHHRRRRPRSVTPLASPLPIDSSTHRRRRSFDDDDDNDDEEFLRWIVNGRDDDITDAKRLLFETRKRPRKQQHQQHYHRYSRHLSRQSNR